MTMSHKYFRPDSSRSKDFRLAKTMMALVLVFLLLNMPRLVLCLIEVLHLPTVEKCYNNKYNFYATKLTYVVDFIARFGVKNSFDYIIYSTT